MASIVAFIETLFNLVEGAACRCATCGLYPLSLTLRNDVLPVLGLTVTQAAQHLGVSRVALSRTLNGRAAISPEMALRIEAWLGVARGGEARLWLAEQSAYVIWQAAQKSKAAPMRVQRGPIAA